MPEEYEVEMVRKLKQKEASHWATVDAVTILQAGVRGWFARRRVLALWRERAAAATILGGY